MPDLPVGHNETSSLPHDTYEGRLTAIFEIVQEAGVNGIACASVRELVPWKAESAEIRAKLMSLRSRDCVQFEDGRWYA